MARVRRNSVVAAVGVLLQGASVVTESNAHGL